MSLLNEIFNKGHDNVSSQDFEVILLFDLTRLCKVRLGQEPMITKLKFTLVSLGFIISILATSQSNKND